MCACWRIGPSSAIVLLMAAVLSAADDGFVKWWPRFQAAVKSGDPQAIAAGASFPMPWELGPVREVASQDELARHFDSLFTADMKRAVATQKPAKIPEGYMITWKARGNEYSLYFHPARGGFVLAGLSEGPP